MQKLLQFSFSDQLVQMIPQISTVLRGVFLVLVVMAIKALVTSHRVSCHLIWSFEERLIFNLLRNLLHRFSEHRVRPWLPSKVSLKSVVIVSIRPKIPPLLRNNLNLFLASLLVLFNPFILINPIHELAYTGNRFPSQRLP